MKRLTYLLLAVLFTAGACKKSDTSQKEEEQKEEEKIDFPASIAGNNKIKVLETTSGASTPEAEYNLEYLIVISKTDDGKAQTVTLPTSTGPNLNLFFNEGMPTENTVFDLENMYSGGKNGVTISVGGIAYTAMPGDKLYIRKNSNGTITMFFNELDLKGTLNRSRKTSAKFTVALPLQINTASPTTAKNLLVAEE